jgi:Acetyltransferase (GNAT) domain
MIVVKRHIRGIPYAQKWFSRSQESLDVFKVVAYFQFLGGRTPSFFLRRPFFTIHIDLRHDPDAIQADMQKTVRYKIRRADNEGLSWEVDVDARDFAEFHDAFSREKGIEGVDLPRIRSFKTGLVLSRVTCRGSILAQHAHVVDEGERRARLVYSSSGRFEGADPALSGRANRWCHWKDMMHFRERGILTYDLGGIAVETKDRRLKGINEFKMGFGGTVIREDHWLSPLYFVASMAGVH